MDYISSVKIFFHIEYNSVLYIIQYTIIQKGNA